MKRTLAVLHVLVLVLVVSAGAQTKLSPRPARLADRIQQIISRPEFRHAAFGIAFYALDTNKPIYSLNADTLFTPASTTKLLTEGTALALLGADYRFRTRVFRTGPIAADGTLQGDLVLVAGGDPNLSGRIQTDGTLAFENEDHSYAGNPDTRAVPGDPLLVIRQLAAQVAAKGIKRIAGRVVIDASLFPEGERELGTGKVISPIVVNDNIIDVTVTPGAAAGEPTTMQVSPATAYARFTNQARAGAAGSRIAVRFGDTANPDGTHAVVVAGSLPPGKPILFAYSVPQPSRFAQVVLAEALNERGIAVQALGGAENRDFRALAAAYTPENLVAEHVSPPLAEEVKVTLKVSQNLHASMTPYILAAVLGKKPAATPEQTPAGRGNPAQGGFDLEREFLQKAGLDVSGASQGDGAGGATAAFFSPDFMVHYLAYMATRPDFAIFQKGLPILGRDGTLFNIQVDSPAAGHVMAKTGTFSGYDALNRRVIVTGKGLAGYLTTLDGHHLAFAVYLNRVPVSADDPDAVTKVAGQAVGEIAAAPYDAKW